MPYDWNLRVFLRADLGVNSRCASGSKDTEWPAMTEVRNSLRVTPDWFRAFLHRKQPDGSANLFRHRL